MAILIDEDRLSVWAEYMKDLSNKRESLGLTKAELRAAVNAIDQWIEDNKASYNNAIPLPARTELSAAQKAGLLMFVVSKRFDKGV